MERTKYPSTPHLPWSESVNDDDKVIKDLSHILGREGLVGEKMDGENNTMAPDYFHARSLDSRHHPSRAWAKGFWGSIAHKIPAGHRICGENLFAKHSIPYENLESFFLGFSVWDESNFCLDWDSTLEIFSQLGIKSVPILYRGVITEDILKEIGSSMDLTRSEGYVVRTVDGFSYDDFGVSIAKYVRKNHVQTDKHWMAGPVIKNKLSC